MTDDIEPDIYDSNPDDEFVEAIELDSEAAFDACWELLAQSEEVANQLASDLAFARYRVNLDDAVIADLARELEAAQADAALDLAAMQEAAVEIRRTSDFIADLTAEREELRETQAKMGNALDLAAELIKDKDARIEKLGKEIADLKADIGTLEEITMSKPSLLDRFFTWAFTTGRF